ncbi:unnamed protein product [Effrenium voratum]|nr:unnamed protein product [Effrenium voratum]
MSRRGVLVVGGVFGSLPFPAPEPFTVRVTSPICEVFFITSADFAKLPRKLLDVVQEYVASSTTWRLSCHQRSTNFRKQGFKRHAPIFDQEEDATDVDTIQEESSVDVNELLEECREERKSQFEHFRKAAFEGGFAGGSTKR